MKLVRIKYTNQHLNNISRVTCLYLHFHLCTSGLDSKDEKFWQALFIAHTILSLAFIFRKSQNLLVSAFNFQFPGFCQLKPDT